MVTLKHVVIGSEVYGMPQTNAQQKSGPTPLRHSLGDADPIEQLASNDDRMNQVVFANGKLWSGVNTVAIVGGEHLVASAFFVVKPSLGSRALSASMDDQGYVAVAHENVLFPSIGVTANGAAAVVFTLAGPDYFPSAAYSPINASAGDVRLAGPGIGPEDGFSGYAALQPNGMSNGGVARWGDYSAAVADGDVAAQGAEHWLVEDLRDQAHVLVDDDAPAVADRDARRLLAPVLQGVEAEVGQLGHVLIRRPGAEHAAGVPGGLVSGVEIIAQSTVWLDHVVSLGDAT